MGLHVVFRTDASTNIGTGHLMRCFALAQVWKKKGHLCYFILATHNPELEARLVEEGMCITHIDADAGSCRDISVTITLAKQIGARWMVVDGYHFCSEYQLAIRNAGFRLLIIDDMAHLPMYHANIIINQNLGAEKLSYKCDPDTILLLGPKYALIRQEYLEWGDWNREIPDVARKILVTMGGSDPDNVTRNVIEALKRIKTSRLETVVIVGASNPHYESLKNASMDLNIKIARNVQNMPELMVWADIAITAGGSTYWELAFMEMPCILIVLAENQVIVAENAAGYDFAINLGWYEKIKVERIIEVINYVLNSPYIRKKLASKGRSIVDGLGIKRVIYTMNSLSIDLRRVTESDCIFLWELVNDPEVREASFFPEYISLESHKQWFREKMNNPYSFLFIGIDENNNPIGQVRFDIEGDQAETSISINGQYRGRGYGSILITKGIDQLSNISYINSFDAYIKPENIKSKRTFIESGFIPQGEKVIKKQIALHLKREKK